MYQLHHTRVSRQHCVLASIAALVYFIRKRFAKYKTEAKPNVDSPSGDRSAASATVVTDSCDYSAVIYAADGSLATAPDKMEEGEPQAFNRNPVAVPSTLVVVDMENEDQEKWTNNEYSSPSRRHGPEDRLQDSLRFSAT